MKRIIPFLVLLTLFACSEEKLRMKTNASKVVYQPFQVGQDLLLEVEHNGDGILIEHQGNPISTAQGFKVSEEYGYGLQRFTIKAYRGTDTVLETFKMVIAPNEPPTSLGFEVVATYPHPKQLFTQGLVLDGDLVIESSGQYGQSALSVYKLGTTDILQQHKLPNDWFCEGLALLDDTLYQVTWKKEMGQTYYWKNGQFTPTRTFKYTSREGWGLCAVGNSLLWTDGSERLRFVDPQTMEVEKTNSVVSNLGLFANLNELEPYKDRVASNIWQTDRIAFIDPATGIVDKVLDLNELADRHQGDGTLNGIMVKGDNIIITGKNWPVMYELKIDW